MSDRLRIFRSFLLTTIFAIACGGAWAAPDFQAPFLSRPVMDEAGLLSVPQIDAVETAVRGLRNATQIQVAIYIPKSLQGYDIESFSMTVAEQWKLGKKGEDKGLVLVVAPSERRMRLEVGYGLEGQITDAQSRRILDQVLRPFLRQNRPAEGLIAVLGTIAQTVGSDWRPDQMPRLRSENQVISTPPGFMRLMSGVLIFAIFIGLALGAHWRRYGPPSRRYRRRSGWGGWDSGGGGWGSGGGFGGGGWSGGGGGFGGGGSSSSW